MQPWVEMWKEPRCVHQIWQDHQVILGSKNYRLRVLGLGVIICKATSSLEPQLLVLQMMLG